MTLQQLRPFLATADHGSFAGAADELLRWPPRELVSIALERLRAFDRARG